MSRTFGPGPPQSDRLVRRATRTGCRTRAPVNQDRKLPSARLQRHFRAQDPVHLPERLVPPWGCAARCRGPWNPRSRDAWGRASRRRAFPARRAPRAWAAAAASATPGRCLWAERQGRSPGVHRAAARARRSLRARRKRSKTKQIGLISWPPTPSPRRMPDRERELRDLGVPEFPDSAAP